MNGSCHFCMGPSDTRVIARWLYNPEQAVAIGICHTHLKFAQDDKVSPIIVENGTGPFPNQSWLQDVMAGRR